MKKPFKIDRPSRTNTAGRPVLAGLIALGVLIAVSPFFQSEQVNVFAEEAILGSGAFSRDRGIRGMAGTPTPTPCAAEEGHLYPTDSMPFDGFGWSVSVDGGTAIVGAEEYGFGDLTGRGSAYAFVRNGANWSQQQKLIGSDVTNLDAFGVSVAIDGDTAVVGANRKNNLTGAAYVFFRTGGTWAEQQKLTASDGTAGDNFGVSVAISGDTVVVGSANNAAPLPGSGAGYVFTRSAGIWTEQQKLTASDAGSSDRFGSSAAVDGDTAVFGATGDNTPAGNDAGSAYVFVRNGGVWSEQQKLTASDAAASDTFGFAAAIEGDTVVVGAELDDTAAGNNAGSSYVFIRNGSFWTEQQKLLPTVGVANALFGISVGISGSNVVVGAQGDTTEQGTGRGSAYVFNRSGNVWNEQLKLAASDGVSGDNFGRGSSIDGDTVVVGAHFDTTAVGGANAGSAYIFRIGAGRNAPSGGGCTPPTPTPTATPAIGFENDVAPRANGDGIVISGDVIQMRRFATGLDTPALDPNEYQRADSAPRATFGDGNINSGDVIQARRYATGLDPATPAAGPTGPSMLSGMSTSIFDDVLLKREIRVSPQRSTGSGTVTVALEITSSGDELATGFTLEYDAAKLGNPRITLAEGSPRSAVLTVNINEAGKIGILVDSAEAFTASAVPKRFLFVTFELTKGATGETAFRLTDSLAARATADAKGNTLSVKYIDSKVDVGYPGSR